MALIESQGMSSKPWQRPQPQARVVAAAAEAVVHVPARVVLAHVPALVAEDSLFSSKTGELARVLNSPAR